jgi:hypothetical protein
MCIGSILGELGSQLIALLTFFLFPIIQYVILRRSAKRKGAPELWYMRRFNCFRLVMRNETKKRVLTDINVKTRTRKIYWESPPLTTSWRDRILDEHQELFTFPGSDHVMICFNIRQTPSPSGQLVITDKFGGEMQLIPLESFDEFLCDYIATVKNPFNFDVKLARRVKLTSKRLIGILEEIEASSEAEQQVKLDDVVDVGYGEKES